MLADSQIKEAIENGEIIIQPFYPDSIYPSSYNFHLGRYILLPLPNQKIDPEKGSSPEYKKIDLEEEKYTIHPGEFLLAQTDEKITLPNHLGMFFDGRTTLARLGLTIHQTATFIFPGHTNSIITLELKNDGNHEIILSKGLRIGKGIFFRSEVPVDVAYKDRGCYPEQSEVMGAKLSSK